jgi:hypothetical protein
MNDGQKVTTPEKWWNTRRPELIEMFSKYVYGRVPNNVPKVTWTVSAADRETIGFTPVIAKEVMGQVDNSSYPAINVRIHMTVVTPANAKGPVPVLMMFGHAGPRQHGHKRKEQRAFALPRHIAIYMRRVDLKRVNRPASSLETLIDMFPHKRVSSTGSSL